MPAMSFAKGRLRLYRPLLEEVATMAGVFGAIQTITRIAKIADLTYRVIVFLL